MPMQQIIFRRSSIAEIRADFDISIHPLEAGRDVRNLKRQYRMQETGEFENAKNQERQSVDQ